MNAFTDEECETLIELIRQHPPIYDARLDSYRDENLKDNIWKRISEIINKTDSECRKKWKLIRDSYNRYKRKQKTSTGSAAPAKNSKWQFYERLRFLENTPSERQSSSNVEQEAANTSSEVGDENTSPVIADASVHNTTSRELEEPIPGSCNSTQERSTPLNKGSEKSTSKNIKRKKQDDDFIKFLKERHENRKSQLEALKSPELVDDISSFTKHIEIMLRNLSARSRSMAKTEIFSIISKYEIGDIDGQAERPYTSSSYSSYSPTTEASPGHQAQSNLSPLQLPYHSNSSYNSYSPISAASSESQSQSELIDLTSRQLNNNSSGPFESIFEQHDDRPFDQNDFQNL